MGIHPIKEQPNLRDLFASNIAGVILSKTDVLVNTDLVYTRKVDRSNDVLLRTVAFLSYKLADKLLEERVIKD